MDLDHRRIGHRRRHPGRHGGRGDGVFLLAAHLLPGRGARRCVTTAQFARARQQFSGQQPLIEVRKGDDAVVHQRSHPRGDAGRRSSSRCASSRMRHPRRKSSSTSRFRSGCSAAPSKNFSFINNGIDFDSDRVRLTLEDLERRGPGLILDQTDQRGSQLLVSRPNGAALRAVGGAGLRPVGSRLAAAHVARGFERSGRAAPSVR